MGPILYAHEHKYKIFILQAMSTISTCAYIRDFTVKKLVVAVLVPCKWLLVLPYTIVIFRFLAVLTCPSSRQVIWHSAFDV